MGHLNSARLRIESLRPEHASVLVAPLQDEAIYTWIPDEAPGLEALTARYQFLTAGRSPDGEEYWLNWVVFLKGTTTPIGTFQATIPKGLNASFAYIVFPPFWRNGYAREMAVRILFDIFARYELRAIHAEIDTRNTASIKLVESLGLTRIKTVKDADFFNGSTSHEHTYAMTRDAWFACHSATD